MKSFIFGSDGLPKTPEELARLRAMADALTPSRSPQNVGEGIASIGNAIVYRALMNKADKGEAAGKANADSMFSKLFGGGEGAFPPAPAPVGDATAAPPETAPKAMAMVSPGNDPVADVLAAGPKSDQPWLKYANQGATRSQPLDPKLVSALGFLPDLGVSAEVFSGGQPTAREGGPRTGSARHDHGGAGDVFFYKDGRKLDWANEQDRPIFEEIVRRGKANGITGFGAGDGYMQPGSMHLGFGAPAVWGAGGKGANAPYWLRKAYAGESDMPGGLAAQPGMAATAAPAMGYAGPAQVASAQPTGANGAPIAQDWLPAEFQQSAQLRGANPDVGVLRALLGKGQATGAGQQTAQALDLNQAIQTMSDPFLSPGKRAVLEALVRKNMDADQARLEQQLKQQSPDYQLDLKLKNAQLDQILNPKMSPSEKANLDFNREKLGIEQQNRNTMTAAEKADADRENARLDLDRKKFEAEVNKGQWQKLTDGRLYNQTTGEFRDAPPPKPGSVAPDFKDVSSLRKEIQNLPSYKNMSQALPIYKAMTETAGRDTKASDLNLVYGLGKIMDPTSVVREGEMVMVKNTGSLPDWLQGAIASLNGGAALTPDTREAIMREAYGRVKGYSDAFQNDTGQYQGIVERNGFNRADVIPDFGAFDPWAPAGKQPSVPAPEGVDQNVWDVMTPEERALWQK